MFVAPSGASFIIELYMYNPENINIEKITFGTINSPGIKFVERKIIDFSKIYNRPIQNNNPTRSKGKNLSHIETLMQSFSSGIDYAEMPPVVVRIPPSMNAAGDIMEYEILAGHHRMEAMNRLGYNSWVFDLYVVSCETVTYEDAIRTFQLKENNHTPRLSSTEDDVVKTVLLLLKHQSKLVEPENSSIWKYVDENCSYMHYNTRAKVVRDIERNLQQNGHMPLYDVMTYTPTDVETFIEQKTDLTCRGNLDDVREQFGWTVLQGYEEKLIMNIAKKFGETGKQSYITLYTQSPTEESSLNDRIDKMIETIHSLGFCILKCAEFYKKHGKMPWHIKGRLPQDRAAGETDYIELD